MFKFGNSNYDQLTADELREIREERVKRVKTWNAIREICIYILFLWCLFVVAYTNVGISFYKYQTNMRQIFIPKVAFFSSNLMHLMRMLKISCCIEGKRRQSILGLG